MTNYLKLIGPLMCLFLHLSAKGQTIETITGNVINPENKVMLGNALIISFQDSTILKGTTFFEESLSLPKSIKKRCYLS